MLCHLEGYFRKQISTKCGIGYRVAVVTLLKAITAVKVFM